MTRVSLIALCALLCLVVVANVNCMRCGEKVAEQALEKAIEKGTGGKAKIDVGSNVDISDLPAALRYPGAAARGRFSTTSEKGAATAYTLESADPAPQVIAFYKAAFSAWKQSFTSETDESTTLVYGNEATKEWTSVTVTKGDKTAIVLTYTKGE
jgi:hypothetical protein